MIGFADAPSMGLVIGVPIGLLLAAAGIAFALIFGRTNDEYGDGRLFFWGGLIAAAIALIVTAIAMWPWSYDYHFWKNVDGKVTAINKRIISTGDNSIEQRFVVVIRGRPYGVDDTRAALLHPGDTVHLRCKREWQWGSSDNGYGCRWNGSAA